MNRKTEEQGHGLEPRGRADRRVRADAQRNIDTLLRSAMEVFATSGARRSAKQTPPRPAGWRAKSTGAALSGLWL